MHLFVAEHADFERIFLTRCVDAELEDAAYLDTQDLLALTHPDAPDPPGESLHGANALAGAEAPAVTRR